jgi:hypothetical protein
MVARADQTANKGYSLNSKHGRSSEIDDDSVTRQMIRSEWMNTG